MCRMTPAAAASMWMLIIRISIVFNSFFCMHFAYFFIHFCKFHAIDFDLFCDRFSPKTFSLTASALHFHRKCKSVQFQPGLCSAPGPANQTVTMMVSLPCLTVESCWILFTAIWKSCLIFILPQSLVCRRLCAIKKKKACGESAICWETFI